MRGGFSPLMGASVIAFCTTPAAGQVSGAAAPVGVTARAQAQGDDSTGLAAPDAGNDIVVTARRRSESLQEVPQTVTAVSGETIDKLNLTQSQDIAAVVPGLTLNQGSVTSGRSPAPALRGVSYDAGVTPSPTVDIYINEVPADAANALTAIYDIQSVQVLRGPQGTERGRTAPSGAILFTTRQADTDEWGGYVSALGTDRGSINGQLALNAPLVPGVLGLRVAGLVDQNDFVRSATGGASPFRDTVSGRASLTFTPTGTVTAAIVYQYLDLRSRQWTQVEGTGSAGGVTPLAPAGYNGPVIRPSDRLAAGDLPRDFDNRSHRVNAQVDWDVAGQQLSYIGGFVDTSNRTFGDVDYGNQIIGNAFASDLSGGSRAWTHEARLSGAGLFGFLDYAVGFFHSKSDLETVGVSPASALAGAFGSPAAPDPRLLVDRYVLDTTITSRSDIEENSVYGNVRLHLTDRLELAGGLRYIINEIDQNTRVFVGAGTIAVRVPAPCNLVGAPASPYPGFCDFPIAASATPVLDATNRGTSRPVVYNATASYEIADDVLVYANTGSSWRRGGVNTGIINVAGDPTLDSFNFTPDETSTSYEIGLKTTLFDRRLRFNAALFHQSFGDFVFQVPSIPFVSTNGTDTQVINNNIVTGADAIVRGFDIDAAFQATRNWSIGAAVSYADGRVNDDLVPCRDSNFDGVPDAGQPTLAQFQAAGVFIAQCRTRDAISRDPLWNLSAQSELFVPVGGTSDVYLRGLLNYFPENDRVNIGFTASDYMLLNLYAGLRSSDGGWDVGLFARNLTNAGVQLARDPALITSTLDRTFGNSGYRFTRFTPPREVGISIRYSFGGG